MFANDKSLRAIQGVMLIALTTLVYTPVRFCGFIWDDNDYVTSNVHLRSIEGLIRIWTDLQAEPQYYPLVHTTFWVEFRLWELNPLGYHVVNVLLHVSSALLLWRLLLRLNIPGSWLAALLFAIHPVQVESVAWITERKNVLSCFFYMLAAHGFIRFTRLTDALVDSSQDRSSRHPAWKWYAPMFLCYVLALLSKTTASSFPAAMLVLMWWRNRTIGLRTVVALLPLFAVGICMGLLTAWLEKYHVGAFGKEWELTFGERFLIAGRAVWFYFSKLIWPYPLTFFYPRWEIDSSAAWQYLFPVAALLLLSVLLVYRRRFPGTLTAALLYGGTLFPALGFVDVYPMRFSWVADHFQYAACIAVLTWLAAIGIQTGEQYRAWKKPLYTLLTLWVCVLMTLTYQQVAIYQSLETLWLDTLHKNPDSWIALNNLGNIRSRQGRPQDALPLFERAIQLKADYPDAHINLGKALADLNRLQESEGHYRRAIELQPPLPILASGLNGLGTVRARRGDNSEAIVFLQKAIQAQPEYAEAHYNLALVYQSLGEFEKASQMMRKAEQLRAKRENSLIKQ